MPTETRKTPSLSSALIVRIFVDFNHQPPRFSVAWVEVFQFFSLRISSDPGELRPGNRAAAAFPPPRAARYRELCDAHFQS